MGNDIVNETNHNIGTLEIKRNIKLNQIYNAALKMKPKTKQTKTITNIEHELEKRAGTMREPRTEPLTNPMLLQTRRGKPDSPPQRTENQFLTCWFDVGFLLVPCWFLVGSLLVPCGILAASLLVLFLFLAGSLLVPSWYPLGSQYEFPYGFPY